MSSFVMYTHFSSDLVNTEDSIPKNILLGRLTKIVDHKQIQDHNVVIYYQGYQTGLTINKNNIIHREPSALFSYEPGFMPDDQKMVIYGIWMLQDLDDSRCDMILKNIPEYMLSTMYRIKAKSIYMDFEISDKNKVLFEAIKHECNKEKVFLSWKSVEHFTELC